MNKFILSLSILIIPFFSSAQGLLEGERINVIALWKSNEVKLIKIQKTRSQEGEGVNGEIFKFTYDIEINVIDSSFNYYELEWTYQNFNLEELVNSSESMLFQVMEKNDGLKIRYRTDKAGTFDRLTNWMEMRVFLSDRYNYLIKYAQLQSEKDGGHFRQFVEQLKPFYTDQQAFESSFMLKDIQQYHYLNGISLELQTPIITEIEQFNPMTKSAIPLDLIINFESYDIDQNIGTIQVDQKYNEKSKAILLEYGKQTARNLGMKIPNDAEMPVMDISESYLFKFNLFDGWPNSIIYTKKNKNIYFNRIDRTIILNN